MEIPKISINMVGHLGGPVCFGVLDRRALGGLVCDIMRATLRSALVYIWFYAKRAVALRFWLLWFIDLSDRPL
jgi:hypothetical protein